MKHIVFIICIAIMMLTACESEVVNVKLPEYRPKLVVTAFLSPSDTVSYVHVEISRPLFSGYKDNMMKLPGKISAFISDGEREVELDSVQTGTIARPWDFRLDPLKMKIEYGRTYNIRAAASNGIFAEATCTVPEKRSFAVKADTVTKRNNYGYSGLSAKISFDDIAGEEDYYRVNLLIKFYNHSLGRQGTWSPRLEKRFFSDSKIDGSNVVIYDDYLSFVNSDSTFLVVELFHTEKSYYLYHQSLDNYRDKDIPFVEPTPVYTNVLGGLGVVTSYTVDSAVFRLK